MALAELWVNVRLSTKEAEKDLNKGFSDSAVAKAGRKAGKSFATGFGVSIRGLGTVLAAAVSAKAISGLSGLAGAASDLNETVSKSENIFGKNAKAMEVWASKSATAFGLTKQAALEGAASFGNFFDQIGIGGKQSVKMSQGLVKLSGDLASFNNADPAQVMEAFQSATRGEYDSLQAFIPTVSAATVETEALRQSHKKSKDDLTNAEKALALYTIAQRDAGKAQGDFARTSGGLANQQRILRANLGNLKTTIGQALLPAFTAGATVLNKSVLPAFQGLAEKYGPKVGKVLGELAGKAGQFFSILAVGDFTSGPLAEDSKIVDRLFDIREGFIQLYGIIFKGDFTSGPFAEDSKFVDRLFDIREGLGQIIGILKNGDFTGGPFEEDSAFVNGLFTIRDVVKDLGPSIKTMFANLKEQGAGESLGSIGDSVAKLTPAIREFVEQAKGVGPALELTAGVLGFFAEHVDTIIKYMPLLVAAFVAYKGAVLAANVATAAAFPLKIAEIAANRQLTKSNLALVASRSTLTTATVAGTAAQTAGTVATNTETVAKSRGRIATLAYTAASKIATIATKLLGLAIKAATGWIGIVITVIALAVTAVITLYKKNEKFRTVVNSVWEGVKTIISKAWGVIKDIFRMWAITYLTLVETLVKGAAKAFGWVPGIGGKLKAAAQKFSEFKDSVNKSLGGVKGKTVTVGAKVSFPADWQSYRSGERMATGGAVRGAGTGTSDSIPARLSNGEHVWTAKEVRAAGGHSAVRGLRSMMLGGARFAAGGPVGLNPVASVPSRSRVAQMGAGIESVLEGAAISFGRALQRQLNAMGNGMANGWRQMWGIVHGRFPGASLTSGFRPGSRTVSGNTSYHALGRAIDVSPDMAIFNWIRANYGRNTKELIYSPAGRRQIKNGRPHFYSGAVRAMHWNHVHWAMANGGIINEPIFGVGASGRTYSFGERGPETVTPGRRGGGAQAVFVNQGVVTTNDVENWMVGVQANLKRKGRM